MADGAISLQQRKDTTQTQSSTGPVRSSNWENRHLARLKTAPLQPSDLKPQKYLRPGTIEYRERGSETLKPLKVSIYFRNIISLYH